MKRILFVIILSILLCGCNDYNNGNIEDRTNSFGNTYDQGTNYSYGLSFSTVDKEDICETTYKVTNEGDGFNLGMVTFVNGIPQKIVESENTPYIYSFNLEPKKTVQSTFTFSQYQTLMLEMLMLEV